ncbi:hypothetical protein AB0D08_09685 [Kitasatospora sp. NPDC048540]|uniref:hypothetical protein n=1 Tax=Kitasatospora sp. NPDC048540 TaxID=3155634 RepID=UPI0033C104CE
MNLSDLAGPALSVFSRRFLLVTLVPVCAGALYLLCLVWAGAPQGGVSFSRAWAKATGLGGAEIALLLLVVLVAAFLTQSSLPALHRLWQGSWPMPFRGRRLTRHRRARARLERRSALPADLASRPAAERAALLHSAYRAARQLDLAYPRQDPDVRPTALGNALAALYGAAGAGYGWDAAAAWPRLYPVLPDRARLLADDARDALDQAVTLAGVGLVAACAGLPLLVPAGWWVLLTLLPAALGALAYRSAVHSVPVYRAAVQTAFDLHRFDLLRALHLPLPADADAERVLAEGLCRSWNRAARFPTAYRHDGP